MAEDGDEGRTRTSDTTRLRLLYRGGLHRALVLRPPLSYLHHLPRIAAETGGVTGGRTPDLFHAMESLSQLSYNPVIVNALEGREAIPRPGAVICRFVPRPPMARPRPCTGVLVVPQGLPVRGAERFRIAALQVVKPYGS